MFLSDFMTIADFPVVSGFTAITVADTKADSSTETVTESPTVSSSASSLEMDAIRYHTYVSTIFPDADGLLPFL